MLPDSDAWVLEQRMKSPSKSKTRLLGVLACDRFQKDHALFA
jgi:hypothetical protein